jgi:hypothetical protein
MLSKSCPLAAWLARFMKYSGGVYKKVHGESSSVIKRGSRDLEEHISSASDV